MRTADQDVVELLRQLIAVPSVGGSQAEATIQQELARTLADLGLSVDLWPLDLAALRSTPDYPGKRSIVTRRGGWSRSTAPANGSD